MKVGDIAIHTIRIVFLLATFCFCQNIFGQNCNDNPSRSDQFNKVREILAHIHICENIPQLTSFIKQIRTRTKNVDGMYSQFPDFSGKEYDMTSIDTCFIVMAIADLVREMEDAKRKDQALSALNPLLVDALSGNIADLSSISALFAYKLTVFDPVFPIIQTQSTQTDSFYRVLLEILEDHSPELRARARAYLFDFAVLVPEMAENIATAIAQYWPNYPLSEIRFDIGMQSSYVQPIRYHTFKELKNKSLMTLVNETMLLENIPRLSTYTALIASYIKSHDPHADEARFTLLSGLKDLNLNSKDMRIGAWLSFVPSLTIECDATLEEKREVDAFLSFMESEVDSGLPGESLEWIATILHRALSTPCIPNEYAKSSRKQAEHTELENEMEAEPVRHIYGTEKVIRILDNLLDKGSTDIAAVYIAVNCLCIMVAQDQILNETICEILSDLWSNQARMHEEGSQKRCFDPESKTKPALQSQSYLDNELLYSQIKDKIQRYCPERIQE